MTIMNFSALFIWFAIRDMIWCSLCHIRDLCCCDLALFFAHQWILQNFYDTAISLPHFCVNFNFKSIDPIDLKFTQNSA